MSGRHKFSDLEAAMSPERRARIARLADKLRDDMVATAPKDLPQAAGSPKPGKTRVSQTRAVRSRAAG